jgi:hypothetical protein
MSTLLKSGLYRLLKSKSFYILLIINLAFNLISLLVYKFSINETANFSYTDNNMIQTLLLSTFGSNFLSILGILIFIGNEFKNGAIRNKIIIGKSRTNIYFTNTVLSMIISAAIFFTGVLEIVLFGLLFFGAGSVSFGTILLQLLLGLLIAMVVACVNTFIAMLLNYSNKGTIIGIIVFFSSNLILSLIIILVSINNILKDIVLFIYKLVPDGQVSYLNNSGFFFIMKDSYYIIFPLISLASIALFTFLGNMFFKKTEIK